MATSRTTDTTATAATDSNDAAVHQAIERINREFPGIVRARNADSAAAWFAPDAILYANGTPAVRGRDAIRQFYVGFFQAIPIQDISFTTEEITERGDLAIETGTNALTVGVPGQAGQTVAGKYLAVWKQQPDGGWLIWRHSPSSDVAPPQ